MNRVQEQDSQQANIAKWFLAIYRPAAKLELFESLIKLSRTGRREPHMTEEVLIFGHDLCPYTSRAREDFARRKIPFNYVNVLQDNDGLERMLKHSNGRRQVPVIVEAGTVTIGFGGS